MSRLPFVLRVAVGAVALAAEKGQEIASGAVSAPITLGSMSAQAFIRMQQDLAELAVRGDHTLETIFPPKEEEQPEWATFDDDEDVDVDLPSAPSAAAPGPDTADLDLPDAVRRLDYPELTLAQLRGRLASLSSDDLAALLAFEREHKARAPFLTMLENRLNR